MKTGPFMFLYRFCVVCALYLIAGAGFISSSKHRIAGTSEDLQQSVPSAVVPLSMLQSVLSSFDARAHGECDSRGTVDPDGAAFVVPTPPGINLARTSLAAVTASSVNGRNQLDAWHYGILNVFDGGNNWHNNINYTHWLTDPGDLYPYVEVFFDVPVSIHGIVVQKGPAFTATFTRTDGLQQDCPASKGILVLRDKVDDISSVRLNFIHSHGVMRVYEIRVLGIAPETDFSVGRPRIVHTNKSQEF